ncbi:transmembrane protein 235-like [Anguilla anguilla]|uniref:transmembrane protein 235-like n=1 Tax=Anguilla anguilla TaxID=7936 RepID=UPI0015B1D279|nr:transmembrane protein 235-like [Anguilla anguilla]
MKINFGTVVVVAGFAGMLSFGFLAAAIGSEYWYIIEVNKLNQTDSEELNSHSGLWTTYEGRSGSAHSIYSFSDSSGYNYTEPEQRIRSMHRMIVILLPLNLVLLVFGGICGLVSALSRSPALLIGSASYIFLCSLLTLCGACLYLSYSQQALEELQRQVGLELMAHVHLCFGWSLGVAWLAFSLEVLTGTLLLLAARMACVKHQRNPANICTSSYTYCTSSNTYSTNT